MSEPASGQVRTKRVRTLKRAAATGRFVASPRLDVDANHAVRNAVNAIVEGREQRELADRKIRRAIFALHDAGWSQRDIAQQAGISQPEVSRRLRRRKLQSDGLEPRDVILQRATGQITTEQMLNRLGALPLTANAPGRSGDYDGAATTTGTAKQLVSAFHEGLLTEEEYEHLRAQRRGH